MDSQIRMLIDREEQNNNRDRGVALAEGIDEKDKHGYRDKDTEKDRQMDRENKSGSRHF